MEQSAPGPAPRRRRSHSPQPTPTRRAPPGPPRRRAGCSISRARADPSARATLGSSLPPQGARTRSASSRAAKTARRRCGCRARGGTSCAPPPRPGSTAFAGRASRRELSQRLDSILFSGAGAAGEHSAPQKEEEDKRWRTAESAEGSQRNPTAEYGVDPQSSTRRGEAPVPAPHWAPSCLKHSMLRANRVGSTTICHDSTSAHPRQALPLRLARGRTAARSASTASCRTDSSRRAQIVHACKTTSTTNSNGAQPAGS